MRLITAAATLLLAPSLLAQGLGTHEPIGHAVRAVTPPVIDGRGDDVVWTLAPPMTGFRQFDPGEDLDPSYATEVRAAYDDHYLYVLVRAYDPHPDSLRALLSRRDVKTSSDQIKIIIDAFHDRRTGIELAVNPAGVKRDYSIYSDIVEDPTWDGVWDVETRIDEKGWVAEFRVPFSQLRFNAKDEHIFGFGVWRDITRLNERDSWPVYRKSVNTLMSQLGTLDGIKGIATPRRLELLPYAVLKNASEPTTIGNRSVNHATVGLDAKVGLTPTVTLDATVNPDFGQVESDPAVLNLSAFEIQFAERRPFFQEGVGLYKCGGPCEGIFYTRRIGRSPQLRASALDPAFTSITGAAKLTGRFANGIAIGIVDAVTEQVRGSAGTTIEPRTNYFVGRAVREFDGGRSQFGAMLTDTRRQIDDATGQLLRRSATTGLVQGYTQFWRDQWQVLAYGAVNRVEGSASAIALTQAGSVHYFQRPDGDMRYDPTRTGLSGNVAGLELTKLRGWIRFDTFLRYATPGLEANDLGFVPLVNDKSVRQEVDMYQLTPSAIFRAAAMAIVAESHWTTGGLPAARSLQLFTSVVLPNSWGAGLNLTATDLGGVNCVSCARGGPALRQSPKLGLRFDLNADPRLAWLPRAAFRAGTSDEGRSVYRGGDLGFDLRVASQFSTTMLASFDHVVNDQQWVGNLGALLSDTTHYTFARLDQNILALTVRGNWTATRDLSFQLYAQPYFTVGAFSQWRELQSARAASYDRRFRAYGGGMVPAGFEFGQFNSNAVIRWEYRPASVLFLVWQQGRLQNLPSTGTFSASQSTNDLFAAHADNTFLIKLSYWFNL